MHVKKIFAKDATKQKIYTPPINVREMNEKKNCFAAFTVIKKINSNVTLKISGDM